MHSRKHLTLTPAQCLICIRTIFEQEANPSSVFLRVSAPWRYEFKQWPSSRTPHAHLLRCCAKAQTEVFWNAASSVVKGLKAPIARMSIAGAEFKLCAQPCTFKAKLRLWLNCCLRLILPSSAISKGISKDTFNFSLQLVSIETIGRTSGLLSCLTTFQLPACSNQTDVTFLII